MRPNPASSCVADVTSLLTSELFSSLVYAFFYKGLLPQRKAEAHAIAKPSLKVTKTIKKGVKGSLYQSVGQSLNWVPPPSPPPPASVAFPGGERVAGPNSYNWTLGQTLYSI
jgi:hypothetical protein